MNQRNGLWLFLILLVFSGCAPYKALMKPPTIYDGINYGRRAFPVSKSEPYHFAPTSENIDLPTLEHWAEKKANKKYTDVEKFIEEHGSTAFLVIRNDSILYENYFNGGSDSAATQIFSVTKPLVVSLLSQAIEEGYISSVDTPTQDFFDFGKIGKHTSQLTLAHLGQMRSGLNQYDYFRLIKLMKLYHALNVDAFLRSKVRVGKLPGKKFKYKSTDTQVLGVCMENMFEEEDLLGRFTSLYWDNIGPEHQGYFSVDDTINNNLKYYGGLNLTARDLAKIGKLYINDGNFEGKQVINEEWIEMINDTTNHQGKWYYNMGWYFDEYSEDNRIMYGAGFNGQYVVINKDTNTVIVRLGEGKKGQEWYHIICNLSKLF